MRVPASLLVLLAAAGCAGPPAPMQAKGPSPRATSSEETGPAGDVVSLSGAGEFTGSDTRAIAYDRKLVPAGAQASVTVESSAGQSRASLVVEGLLPGRRYGAHLHAKACGREPDEAGPHFQHHPGQVDAASEYWLDVTTDGEGSGRATVRHEQGLTAGRLPGSLVIHAGPTVTSGPQAGQAGDRVACLSLR
ncbi:superoxide dismutase family protein [Actinomadura sp. ATCC 31491]|uniref:Superoxide dismutase family protein n=1 Tax=Actinomadura luzonensis TaxID=2805427 RepID=A0ABT0FJQ5_9ACTN|nr:superoxide dismutase family protein [Actinomadura luzonensis]MCK2212540.1 superoxide dismutase family protein [Actinomadura luzonensis]